MNPRILLALLTASAGMSAGSACEVIEPRRSWEGPSVTAPMGYRRKPKQSKLARRIERAARNRKPRGKR